MIDLFGRKARKEAERIEAMAASVRAHRPTIAYVDGRGEIVASNARPLYQFEAMAAVSPSVAMRDAELVAAIMALSEAS